MRRASGVRLEDPECGGLSLLHCCEGLAGLFRERPGRRFTG
jgi:hypothetical protein